MAGLGGSDEEMEPEYQWLLEALGTSENVKELLALAGKMETAGNLYVAATALDRAFATDPRDSSVRQARQRLLDRLAVSEHGIVFRYVPAGSFLMGSAEGDPDERPVRSVQLNHFWIAETPISWTDYCRLMDWEPPPIGMPKDLNRKSQKKPDKLLWQIGGGNKIRLQYCEDETQRARDWHADARGQAWKTGAGGAAVSSQQLFGEPRRGDPTKPWGYASKPMVCVNWEEAERLCSKLSQPAAVPKKPSILSSLWGRKPAIEPPPARVQFRLPSEAEWEKAARGGLVACRYPWGGEPLMKDFCDFDRFEEFSILQMKRFPYNEYGLYAMSGCVWEWTSDWYDAEYYLQNPVKNPKGPSEGKQKVVRGGSWADCAEAVTVSFRMAMGGEGIPSAGNPNVGFRLCRSESLRAE
jgi:formylglycine-generating enzyme required for sulfatase activity